MSGGVGGGRLGRPPIPMTSPDGRAALPQDVVDHTLRLLPSVGLFPKPGGGSERKNSLHDVGLYFLRVGNAVESQTALFAGGLEKHIPEAVSYTHLTLPTTPYV